MLLLTFLPCFPYMISCATKKEIDERRFVDQLNLLLHQSMSFGFYNRLDWYRS
ncbi:hypothetical protein M758_3G146300 [Ceratodon purpureus]|uniref:Uncharacterized protein n=1 Tax=Ceratodon purpureus TaxID=3225 RepID=A0A8T0IKX4_CERPU|nr:hypothetical protein KC19_3G145200 [Ceratodon purpureus]KAG0623060.1 hypothetical protein M758_3G146300 [Ceratodon purpureus]